MESFEITLPPGGTPSNLSSVVAALNEPRLSLSPVASPTLANVIRVTHDDNLLGWEVGSEAIVCSRDILLQFELSSREFMGRAYVVLIALFKTHNGERGYGLLTVHANDHAWLRKAASDIASFLKLNVSDKT